jgi:cobalt-zinc-cadmium efflux system outer membrane protein
LGDYSESYLNLTQRMDFFWEGRDRSGRAEALRSGARARFAADSALLGLELKRVYLAAWRHRDAWEALLQANEVVEEILAAAGARFEEGELAGYDLRRLRLEQVRLGQRMATAELDVGDVERHLAALLDPSLGFRRVRAESIGSGGPEWEPASDNVARALGNRPEMVEAMELVGALRAEAGLTRKSILTGTSITGGLKRQSDGLDGLFVGLEVPLPLADRRAGARDAVTAAVAEAELQVELLGRAITREAILASARLESTQRQMDLIGPDAVGEAQELLAIARLSYAEGELTLVELLDATEVFIEARLLDSQIISDLWKAFFELDHAVGGYDVEFSNGGSER